MLHRLVFARVVLVVLIVLVGVTRAGAQTSNFTYQGKLTDGATAANGAYDFQFALWDSAIDGAQVGSTQSSSNVAVSNGVFTVALDFGANSFPGADRFLEIAARPSGTGPFTLLAPRQQVTSSPYAVRSANASSANALAASCVACITSNQIATIAASKLTGTIPVAAVPPFSGNYIQNSTIVQPGNFNISGNGTIGGNLTTSASGKVLIGTTASTFKMEVVDVFNGVRVQTNNPGGVLASYGGFGEFRIDAPNIPGGRVSVKENGDVGIGTTDLIVPQSQYHGRLTAIGRPNAFTSNGIIVAEPGLTGVGGLKTSPSFGVGGEGVVAIGGDASNGGFSGDGVVARAGFADAATGTLNGRAASFIGDVFIEGSLDVIFGSKNFLIDHPLDPTNKYLRHAAIESSEVLNVYSGNVVTDAHGEATVALPAWFETLNKDLRYQLTVIGTFAQAIVGSEVKNNRFSIKTNVPGVKVSWQVTGVRSDAAILRHPLKVEEDKPASERGTYLVPEAFGQPEEKGANWVRHPALRRHVKESREAQHDQP